MTVAFPPAEPALARSAKSLLQRARLLRSQVQLGNEEATRFLSSSAVIDRRYRLHASGEEIQRRFLKTR
jgi:hypothetical protein